VNSNTKCEQAGVYGTLGIPAAGNVPGSRVGAAGWTDSNGVLWLFGGGEEAADGASFSYFNDLWAFDPSTLQWTWMGGNSTGGAAGVYGTLGVSDLANVPGARLGAARWTDASGNFWLFGGSGFDSLGRNGDLNDLWEFNPSTRQWTWMGGSSTLPGPFGGQPGVYGVLGSPAAGNIPGGRTSAATWTDKSGDFWLFGGSGTDSSGNSGTLNDLWEFDPSTHQWTWMGGSSVMTCTTTTGTFKVTTCGQPGVYGTLGTAAGGNVPQGITSTATWTDSGGNLWLFGGQGEPIVVIEGQLILFEVSDLNELWEFNPSTREWAWIGGGSASSGYGAYGTLGVPAPGNFPGDRSGAASWTDSGGNVTLFGGSGSSSASSQGGLLNDLWQFDPSSVEWTWVGGNSSITNCLKAQPPYTYVIACGQPGSYGVLGTPAAANMPGGRDSATTWTDSGGNLWLFGGLGFDSSGNYGYLNDLWEYQVNAPGAPPTVTVTAASVSRFFGQANPSLNSVSYRGFLNGDGPSSLSGVLNCTTTATQASAAGTYPITCSGLSSATYSVDFVAGVLSVTPAPLTIRANDATKILNAALPSFSATYAGFATGDGPSSLTGTLSCTSTATATSPVGTYPITCSGQSSNNYAIAYASGSLKIIYQPGGICDKDLGHSILQPINVDGSSVWNQGKTIPVKFRVCDANGVSIGTPGVVAGFSLTQVLTGTVAKVDKSASSASSDTTFRWDPNAQEWTFNLSTSNQQAGNMYVYTILLNDGSTITFRYGLK
jgi:N-acetylneuraminic acid mutarotase